jgi:hypothetical protein
MVTTPSKAAGSKAPVLAKACISSSSRRARTASASARAVATMPRPDFTNSASPTMARSRSSWWLTADWVTSRRCAARVTERSSNTASSTCSSRPSMSE